MHVRSTEEHITRVSKELLKGASQSKGRLDRCTRVDELGWSTTVHGCEMHMHDV